MNKKTILENCEFNADIDNYCFVHYEKDGTWTYSQEKTEYLMLKTDLAKENSQLCPVLSLRFRELVWSIWTNEGFKLVKESEKQNLDVVNIYKDDIYSSKDGYYLSRLTAISKIGSCHTLYLDDETEILIPDKKVSFEELKKDERITYISNLNIWLFLSYVKDSPDYVKDFVTGDYIYQWKAWEVYKDGNMIGLTIADDITALNAGLKFDPEWGWIKEDD